MVKSAFLGELEDQVGGGLNDLLKAADVGGGEARNILPLIAGQPAGGVVEACCGVRPLHIDLDLSVRLHLRMDDLRAIVQGHEWVHHRGAPFLKFGRGWGKRYCIEINFLKESTAF